MDSENGKLNQGGAEIAVQMLGELFISCGEIVVSDSAIQSYNTWLMLAYLIYHRHRWVSQDELIQLLGGREEIANPGDAIRATLLCVRQSISALSKKTGLELVVSKGGSLGWNSEAVTRLDTEVFAKTCQAAADSKDDGEKLRLLQQALEMVHGGFLYRYAGEPWVSALNTHYNNMYLEAVEETLSLLEDAGASREAVTLCRSALQSSPYSESLYRSLMRSLMSLGEYRQAVAAYEELRVRLQTDLDVLPEEQTREVCQDAIHRLGDVYVTPDMIRSQLREGVQPTRVLLCDYQTFKLFYQAEARSADRRGDAIHLGLLSVTSKDGSNLSERALERAMDQLRDQIQQTLRIGDIATCCSASQYLIMLVQANYENSVMVCRRVVNAFARADPHSSAAIQSTILPLEPLFVEGQ